MSHIHPMAIVHPNTTLGEGVQIGPFAVIEEGVTLGDGCIIAAHGVIKAYTRMGRRNHVHEHAVIGGTPQELSFRESATRVEIGDENTIREGVTIHRSAKEGQVTRIGSRNYLMAYSHVGHDGHLGDNITLANNALLAGHSHVDDGAFISGAVAIHQFCRVGKLAMIGGNSKVVQDCLPFVITDGNPARARGINGVGLRRAGTSNNELRQLKKVYRTLTRSGLPMNQRLTLLAEEPSPFARQLHQFILDSERGFAHAC